MRKIDRFTPKIDPAVWAEIGDFVRAAIRDAGPEHYTTAQPNVEILLEFKRRQDDPERARKVARKKQLRKRTPFNFRSFNDAEREDFERAALLRTWRQEFASGTHCKAPR